MMADPSSIVELGHTTFKENVLTLGNYAEHWIVRFCHRGYHPCAQITQPYQQLAAEFSGKLNTRSTMIQFANVDCAMDKALCTEQSIERFPKVVHYSGQQKVAHWLGKHSDG